MIREQPYPALGEERKQQPDHAGKRASSAGPEPSNMLRPSDLPGANVRTHHGRERGPNAKDKGHEEELNAGADPIARQRIDPLPPHQRRQGNDSEDRKERRQQRGQRYATDVLKGPALEL